MNKLSDRLTQCNAEYLIDGKSASHSEFWGLKTDKTNAAKFEGGATRSHHAPRYELVPKAAIDRLTARLEFGAGIHGDHNWRSGGPEFVKQCKRHLMEHLLNYLAGDSSDDHLAAVLCNAAFLAHFDKYPPAEDASVVKA